MLITRELQIALATWTSEVDRARREYEFHPSERDCPAKCKCPMRAAGWRKVVKK